MKPMSIIEMVAESNRIEGITRPPTDAEATEFVRFLGLREVVVPDLVKFVRVYQPDARMRDRRGLNVRVGNHVPPPGGSRIEPALEALLADASGGSGEPWRTHLRYERLHPFTDGNGRSGRMLWYWQMRHEPHFGLGFLHAFYYQTLAAKDTTP